MRKIAAVLAAVLTASAAAGCEDAVGGSPTTPGGEPPPSQAAPVPQIKQPLEPGKFLDKPCDLLPEKWVKERGFDPGTEGRDMGEAGAGPRCSWSSPIDTQDSDEGDLQVVIETANQKAGTGGLKGWYEQLQAGRIDLFEMTDDVAGYPAAYVDVDDRRAEGDVVLTIGIQDDLAVSVSGLLYMEHPERADPEVRAAAEQVIQTLKGAQ